MVQMYSGETVWHPDRVERFPSLRLAPEQSPRRFLDPAEFGRQDGEITTARTRATPQASWQVRPSPDTR